MAYLYRNEVTGWIGLCIDGELRHIPSMEVFFRLFQGDPALLGMNRFSSDDELARPRGRDLSTSAALIQDGDEPRIYLIDATREGVLVRRPIADLSTFDAFGFARSVVRATRPSDPTKMGNLVRVVRTLYAGLGVRTLTQASVDQINSSGFTTLCIYTASIERIDQQTCKITLGGVTLAGSAEAPDANVSAWAGLLSNAKRSSVGGSLNRILLSTGGDSRFRLDFRAIRDFWRHDQGFGEGSPVRAAFAALKRDVPAIDGIDLDNEEWETGGGDELRRSMVAFIDMLGELGFSVTFCAFNNMVQWATALSEVRDPTKVTECAVQCYDGGAVNQYTNWADSFRKLCPTLDLSGFLIPGYWCRTIGTGAREVSPAEIGTALTPWFDAGCGGFFLWNFEGLGGRAARDFAAVFPPILLKHTGEP